MKLKNIKGDPIVNTVLLKMPKEIFEEYKETGLPTDEVLFHAPFSGPDGYWVKTKDTGNRIFPIWGRNPQEILEWEVIS